MNVPALFCVDSYKLGHANQYPEGTEYVYSNFTPRSVQHFCVPDDFANETIIAYGMYAAVVEIERIFDETFFSQPLDYVLEDIQCMYSRFTGESRVDTKRYAELHEYGRLPVTIKALPEGTHVVPQTPVLTIVNTQPRFFWVTNFLEVWLSNTIWKPMTSATIAWNYRQILEHYAKVTGAPPDFVDYQGHDFSLRGMSGMEDGARTGVGHLLSFSGSDNVAATWYAEDIYVSDIISGSVPATEHSVMSCGTKADEINTIRRIITEVYPSGIVSIVSDTWNFWDVITAFARKLKPEILSRDGKVVFRPDSGDPVDILCGSATLYNSALGDTIDYMPAGIYRDVATGEYWQIRDSGSGTGDFYHINQIFNPTAEMKGAVECLWDFFGGTTTDKGYKVLDSHVGLIYGDSITMQRAQDILAKLALKGFASNNVVLGIGSFTYQYVTRDTLGSAMKATQATIDGKGHQLTKDPITDHKKKSATGFIRVEEENGRCVTYDKQPSDVGGLLEPILEDGNFTELPPEFAAIKARVNAEDKKLVPSG